MRILGIHFDQRMTWKDHIDQVIKRSAHHLSWFRRCAWTPGLSRRWRRTAYLALVRSRFAFGNAVFCGASNRQLRRLAVLQNNCLRAILNVRLNDRVRVVDLQRRTGVESVADFLAKSQQRYISKAVTFVQPIREDIESVRNAAAPPARSPATILNCKLPAGPLPAPQ
jgi:hypothetical protein